MSHGALAGRRGTPAALLGRAREIEEITNRLLEPGLRGAVVLGAGGMGKTALADQVLERLGELVAATHIHGSPVLSRMSYGVLSRYLEAAGPEDMESPLAVLRTIRRHFRRAHEAGGPQPLLVVDDAQHLDEASCHVLTQLAMSGELRLLVLSRPRAPQIHELLSLASDGLLARIDLGPLTPAAVHEVCEGILGGPVLRATSALLADASGGNPLYLKSLLARSRRGGQLAEGNGAWFLRREPDGMDASVVDLVKGQLSGRTPEERTVLETLALGQPLPLDVLADVCGRGHVQSLVADGIIELGAGSTEPASLAQPLHADVIRALVPAVRSADIRTRVMERLASGVRSSSEEDSRAVLRRLEWALDCGGTVSDKVLLEAARVANNEGRSYLAIRLGAAVQSAPYLLAARVEIAAAYVETANFAQARVLLEGMLEPEQPTLAPDQLTLHRAATTMARLLHRTGRDPSELEGLAAAWTAAAAGLADRLGGSAEVPAAVAQATQLIRIMAQVSRGEQSAAEAELAGIVSRVKDTGPDAAETAIVAHCLQAEVLAARGEITAALENSARAVDLIGRYGRRLHGNCGAALVRHALALLHGGRFAELENLLAAKLAGPAHQLVAFGGTLGVFEGALEIHQGRLREGLNRLHPAVEALRVSDPEMLLPYALGLAGYASTVVGDQIQTARYAKELHAVGYTGPRQLWLVGQAYAAAAMAAHDPDGTAPAELAGFAGQARAEGLRTAEKDILELCLAVGDLRQAGRLMELTADYEGGEAAALHAYAGAVVSGNPDRMVAAADEAVQHRKYLIAVESIGHAIRFYGTHGNLRRQRALIQQLRRRREELAGVTVSYLSPSLHLVRLTRREHEIVDLLLAGASSKDVASHFTLSQRTVEGHVYRIYVKLGISRRADLEAAYRALEPGPSAPAAL